MLIDLITGIERMRAASMEAAQPAPGERTDTRGAWDGDSSQLERALRSRIKGEVRFDNGSRALYSTDASNYRQIPIGVVVPRDADDVIATVETARAFKAPILARGGGTSLAGQCCNVAIVLDFSKYMNRVLEINAQERWVRVEPGIVLDVLRAAVAPNDLWFGPDPATHSRNTLGGMIGNNSCGMHAQYAGKTEENTLELEILTYDGLRLTVGATSDAELAAFCARDDRVGEIYRDLTSLRDTYADAIRKRFPDIPRRVSGYALDELLPERGFQVARALVGSESTCVLVLSAKLRLMPNPKHRCMVVAGFSDVFAAADAVHALNEFKPIALEGFDRKMIDMMQAKGESRPAVGDLPPGDGWLMIEFGDVHDKSVAVASAESARESLRRSTLGVKLIEDDEQQAQLWSVREAALGAVSKVPHQPDTHPGWEDSAAPPERIGAYLRELHAIFLRYGYDPSFYGHFGQGCIHTRVAFDLTTADGIATWRSFLREAAGTVAAYGGSLSGEHGDGQARGEFLPIMYGEEVCEAFRTFRRIWDPAGQMNPGKVIDAYPVDSNLRLGTSYRPWEPETHFSFAPDDRGSFAYAANRCVGVGECRRHDGKKTMCPSYRVTGEEMHSTRGRARLLFEMLEGAPLTGGWQSEAVKEALDLCLACKGCKGDCPVNVDMATYKAEFLSHYYERRPRPVWAYAFGLIPWWAHVASVAPRAVNALMHAPVIGAFAKTVARVAPQRRIPPFAEQSFRSWWNAERTVRPNAGKTRVLLWPDTFNTYFHADTAIHAAEVLESAGYDVVVPQAQLCCGRPLYDYGMLDLAKLVLRETIDALRADLAAGTPVVVLEPSCASVFKDELLNLFPHDADAARLSAQVVTIGDFLANDEHWPAPKLSRHVVLHGHCHHKAVLGMDGDRTVLARMGADVDELDDGCCGMAGAFGFEAGEHYDVAMKTGELAYLPAMRGAAAGDIIIGDGFSCREQAMQATERQPLHLADVVWLALRYGPSGPPDRLPELAAMPSVLDRVARARRDAVVAAGVAATLVAAAMVAGVMRLKKRD